MASMSSCLPHFALNEQKSYLIVIAEVEGVLAVRSYYRDKVSELRRRWMLGGVVIPNVNAGPLPRLATHTRLSQLLVAWKRWSFRMRAELTSRSYTLECQCRFPNTIPLNLVCVNTTHIETVTECLLASQRSSRASENGSCNDLSY